MRMLDSLWRQGAKNQSTLPSHCVACEQERGMCARSITTHPPPMHPFVHIPSPSSSLIVTTVSYARGCTYNSRTIQDAFVRFQQFNRAILGVNRAIDHLLAPQLLKLCRSRDQSQSSRAPIPICVGVYVHIATPYTRAIIRTEQWEDELINSFDRIEERFKIHSRFIRDIHSRVRCHLLRKSEDPNNELRTRAYRGSLLLLRNWGFRARARDGAITRIRANAVVFNRLINRRHDRRVCASHSGTHVYVYARDRRTNCADYVTAAFTRLAAPPGSLIYEIARRTRAHNDDRVVLLYTCTYQWTTTTNTLQSNATCSIHPRIASVRSLWILLLLLLLLSILFPRTAALLSRSSSRAEIPRLGYQLQLESRRWHWRLIRDALMRWLCSGGKQIRDGSLISNPRPPVAYYVHCDIVYLTITRPVCQRDCVPTSYKTPSGEPRERSAERNGAGRIFMHALIRLDVYKTINRQCRVWQNSRGEFALQRGSSVNIRVYNELYFCFLACLLYL